MRLTNPKTGEKVTLRQFFQQWKKGLEEITPLQQTITVQFGQIISAIGIIWGIIFSIRLGYWWMALILVGGMVVLAVQYLGNWQKKMILKKMDEVYLNIETEVENGPAIIH